jgi:hypothetical protein
MKTGSAVTCKEFCYKGSEGIDGKTIDGLPQYQIRHWPGIWQALLKDAASPNR